MISVMLAVIILIPIFSYVFNGFKTKESHDCDIGPTS